MKAFRVFLIIVPLLLSCVSNTKDRVNEGNQSIESNTTEMHPEKSEESNSGVSSPVHAKASEFIKCLQSGRKLESFFRNNWTLVYHEDNRLDGSSDGEIESLTNCRIDTIIRLSVYNDGHGWEEHKEPKTHNLEFSLKHLVKGWNRFEIPDYEYRGGNKIHVVGKGESDYIVLFYDSDNLIVRLEYRSEDPG